MPQRIANVAITLHRDGKRIEVLPGKPFNFTKEEINDLKALNENALRLPVDESDPNLEDANIDGSKEVETRTQKQTVKTAKMAGPAAGSAKTDKKKSDDKAVKEEGSDNTADDGEL